MAMNSLGPCVEEDFLQRTLAVYLFVCFLVKMRHFTDLFMCVKFKSQQ